MEELALERDKQRRRKIRRPEHEDPNFDPAERDVRNLSIIRRRRQQRGTAIIDSDDEVPEMSLLSANETANETVETVFSRPVRRVIINDTDTTINNFAMDVSQDVVQNVNASTNAPIYNDSYVSFNSMNEPIVTAASKVRGRGRPKKVTPSLIRSIAKRKRNTQPKKTVMRQRLNFSDPSIALYSLSSLPEANITIDSTESMHGMTTRKRQRNSQCKYIFSINSSLVHPNGTITSRVSGISAAASNTSEDYGRRITDESM